MITKEFTPRFTIPNEGNKYYNRIADGGYNPCILGNYPHNASRRTGYPKLNVLPNCTGYSTGRFNEIIGENKCKYLGKGNAKDYFNLAKSQGLKVGNKPKLGACIVWTNKEYGHVAIVERIISENAIVIGQSGWNSTRPFWTATHYKGDGNWISGTDYSWMNSGNYKLLGFIYNPALEEEDEVTQEQFNTMMDTYLQERLTMKASNYQLNALNWAKENGVMVGDALGNQMPQSFLTRGDFVTVLKAVTEKIDTLAR